MTRYEILNHLLKTNNGSKYLEIGYAAGECFRRIQATTKVSVDPDPRCKAMHVMTSDAFFKTCKDRYDVVFIDGLHIEDQVLRDFENAMRVLTPHGIIMLHDCLPRDNSTGAATRPARGPWHGTVWKAWLQLRRTYSSKYLMCCIDAADGCGVVIPWKQPLSTPVIKNAWDVTEYRADAASRGRITPAEFLKLDLRPGTK